MSSEQNNLENLLESFLFPKEGSGCEDALASSSRLSVFIEYIIKTDL